MRKLIAGFILGAILGGVAPVAARQGPAPAQIQAALRALGLLNGGYANGDCAGWSTSSNKFVPTGCSGGGGGSNPGGTGTNLQYRAGATTFGGLTGSSISGSNLTIGGTIGASNFSGTSSGTNTGDQTITLTGNVTGSGTSSFATTIANLAVTNGMLAGSIAYSKLSLTGAILNADLAGSITFSKLVGTDITGLGTVTTGTWNATTIAFNHGGTNLTSAADDTTLVSSGSAWVAASLPNCTDTGGNHLNYATATNLFSCGTSGGGGGSPAGSSNDIQINSSGSFGADTGVFIYNASTHLFGATTFNTLSGAFGGLQTAVKTSNYTFTDFDRTVRGDSSGGTFTVTLKTVVGQKGFRRTVCKVDTSTVTLSVGTSSGQTIGASGASTYPIIVEGCVDFEADGTSAWIVTGSTGAVFTDPGADKIVYWQHSTNSFQPTTLSSAFSSFSGTLDLATAGVALTKLAAVANNTVLCNTTGSSASPSACTSLPLTAISLFNAGVCQDTTGSIGLSLPAAASAPTAHCYSPSNLNMGVAQFTAASSAQTMQGHIKILEAVSSTTFNVVGDYLQETTSTGNVVWTFSYKRVAAGGTFTGSWTDVDITDAAGTADQLNPFTQSVTIGSLAVGDIVFWKFTLKTMPTTSGNQDVIDIALLPVLAKPIGG